MPQRIKDLVELHQEGFTRRITERQRRYIVAQGDRRGTIEGGRTPFFLRRTTKVFRTPARPIIGPFWLDVRDETIETIRKSFRRKMRGERI